MGLTSWADVFGTLLELLVNVHRDDCYRARWHESTLRKEMLHVASLGHDFYTVDEICGAFLSLYV